MILVKFTPAGEGTEHIGIFALVNFCFFMIILLLPFKTFYHKQRIEFGKILG